MAAESRERMNRPRPSINRSIRSRKLAIAAAIAALGTLPLTACGSAASPTSPSASSSGAGITVDFWGDAAQGATMKEIIGVWNKTHPSSQVNGTWVQENYEEKVLASIAGGAPPDVMEISNTSLAGFTSSLLPLQASSAPYANAGVINGGMYQGKLYALPFQTDPKVMAVNESLFQQAGVPLPSRTAPMTVSQFAALATRLSHGSGKQRVYGSAELWFDGFLTALGGGVYNSTGTACTLDSSQALATLNLIINSQTVSDFAPSYQAALGQDMSQWFDAGRLAMVPDTGPWDISNYTTSNTQWEFIPMPGLGEPLEIDNFGVLRSTAGAQRQTAETFVRWISTSPAAQDLLVQQGNTLGIPIIGSAITKAYADLPAADNMAAFEVDARIEPIWPSVGKDPQIETNLGNVLDSDTAMGTGNGSAATALKSAQQSCTQTLTSNSLSG
jgi:multiple sugar transport system substrate-binding protein